jgi:polysaccharide biosynthesis protein PslH
VGGAPTEVRILFLSRWYPWPADNGSKLRVSGLLRGLCGRHEVSLLSFMDPAEPADGPPTPAPAGIRRVPFRDYQPGSRRALLGFMSGTPRFLVDTHSPQMEHAIREELRVRRFDLVIVSQLSMAAYHRAFAGIPAIFEEVELGIYRRTGGQAETAWKRLRREMTWAKHRRFMADLLGTFRLCTVASEVERRLVSGIAPATPVHVVPNSIEATEAGPVERTPASLIFTGSLRYGPNREALAWFLDDVFPSIRAGVPGATLTVTGDTGPGAVPAAAGLHLTGRVPDVRPLVAGSSVSIAPILAGGGTRLKILEAMSVGTPVVTTPKGAEGLGVVDGEHLLLASSPAEFAGAVSRLLRDSRLAADIGRRGRDMFAARYASTVVLPEFLRIVESAAAVEVA